MNVSTKFHIDSLCILSRNVKKPQNCDWQMDRKSEGRRKSFLKSIFPGVGIPIIKLDGH